MWCLWCWLCSRPAGPILCTEGLLRLCPRVFNPPHSCHVLLILCNMSTMKKLLGACVKGSHYSQHNQEDSCVSACGISLCVLPLCVLPFYHCAPLLSNRVSLYPPGKSTDVCRETVSLVRRFLPLRGGRLGEAAAAWWSGAGPRRDLFPPLPGPSLCLIQWAHLDMPGYTVSTLPHHQKKERKKLIQPILWRRERAQSVVHEFLTIILVLEMCCNTTKVTFLGPLEALEVIEKTLNPLHSCTLFISLSCSMHSTSVSVVFHLHQPVFYTYSRYIPFFPSCCGETLKVTTLWGHVIEITAHCCHIKLDAGGVGSLRISRTIIRVSYTCAFHATKVKLCLTWTSPQEIRLLKVAAFCNLTSDHYVARFVGVCLTSHMRLLLNKLWSTALWGPI